MRRFGVLLGVLFLGACLQGESQDLLKAELITPVPTAVSAVPLIGAQVYIEPGQTRQDMERWFKLLADHHMPVCRIRMFEAHMRQPDGTWDFTLYDQAFAAAHKHGVKVMATLFPETGESVGGFKFPRDEAQFRSIAAYIKAVVTHFKDHPALETWVLQNEPGVDQKYPTDKFTMKRFRAWKASRSASSYDNGFMKRPMDFELFMRDYTTWYLRWIAAEIQRYDAAHYFHVNNHSLFTNLVEYDFPRWMSFLSSLGASIHASWHLGYFQRDQYGLAIGADCDIIRDAAEPKPFWVTEMQGGNNLFSAVDPMCPTRADIAQWLWTSIAAGARRVIFWTLNARATGQEAGEWAMITFQNEPSERLDEASRVARTLQEHADFFAWAEPVLSDVTLLYSPESMIAINREDARAIGEQPEGRRKGAHIKSVLAYYEALQELGISPRVKQMDDFDWELRTDHVRVAILANMVAIPSHQWHRLYNFVENGNKLIITGLSGFFDENMHNVFMTSDPLRELLGASPTEFKLIDDRFEIVLNDPPITLPAHLWRGEIKVGLAEPLGTQEGAVIGVRNRYKRGEVVWIPSPLGLGAWHHEHGAFAAWLDRETRPATARLPVRFKTHVPHVYMKSLATGERLVTVLVSTNPAEVTVALDISMDRRPRILHGGALSQDVTAGRVRIAPEETIVILWE